MKWSIKLGRYAGIDVYLHLTFLLLLVFVAFAEGMARQSLGAAIAGVVFFSALFLCVLLHEFGHALTARHYGIRTLDITLLPIGGLARLERMPDKPVQELWVALAGPAVNVVIAAILALVVLASGSGAPLWQVRADQGSLVERLLAVNVLLVLFNLLPAFPMDGGRVLRALLAMRMNYARATRIAGGLGKLMAVVFAILSFFGNPLLLFIAFFVWMGASQEVGMAEVKTSLRGIPVRQAMMTQFQWVAPDEPLSRAAELLLAGWQQDFPVVQDGRVVGVLTRNDLINSLATLGPQAPVGNAMKREVIVVQENEPLDEAMFRHRLPEVPLVHVERDGRVLGLVTMENVAEFVMIRNAIAKASAQPNARPATPPPLPNFSPPRDARRPV